MLGTGTTACQGSLDDASFLLVDAGTVTFSSDRTIDDLLVYSDVVFDLNGHTLEVNEGPFFGDDSRFWPIC